MLKNIAGKDDALALLKQIITQKDDITDFRDEVRVSDNNNTKEATILRDSVLHKIDTVQKNLGFLQDKLARKGDDPALRAHLAMQKNQAAPFESMKTLTDQVAEIHGMLGTFRLESGKDTVNLRQDLQLIHEIVSRITSYDTTQVAGIEGEIASLRYALSSWNRQAEQPSVIPKEQYASLKEDIVAAIEEKSARQSAQLRDDILEAVRSLGISDTSADGSTMGSKNAPARQIPGTDRVKVGQ